MLRMGSKRRERHVTPTWVTRGNAQLACANLLKLRAAKKKVPPSRLQSSNRRVAQANLMHRKIKNPRQQGSLTSTRGTLQDASLVIAK